MELCPFPKHVIQASYQPFESGYLIWRGDTQEIYVLPANETYFSNWQLLPAVNQTEPIPSAAPPGSYAPGKQFAGLWSSFKIGVAEAKSEGYSPIEMPLNEFLGWATAPEQVYDMTMQFSWGNKGTVASPILLLSFPDQRVATLIAAGGPNSTSGPAWFP
jgi:hypothetical protein